MADPDGESIRCPGCGTPLLSGRLEGLCPVCLMEDTAEPDLLPFDEPHPAPPPHQGPGLMQLPGYQLSREIARGGMGIIYEAVQLNPSRTVAVKMLLPHFMDEPAMRERFRREAQAMAGLDHPGILPVYEVGDYNGLPYFSMKLAAGGTLAGRTSRYQGDWRAIASLVAELADAIQTAHNHGVLHRDLKPGNILFDEQNRAYLSDFGIAKQLSASPASFDLTKSATLLGTPNYLPPEWAAGTARSPTTAGDVYGLGVILYQLITGGPPHRAGQLTTLLRQIADEPAAAPRSLNPAVPQDLEVICLHSIAKDPAHRYAGAKELAEDLRLWLDGRPIRARAASPGEKAWRWARRNPLPASLAALLVAALTVGGSALWISLRESRRNLHSSLVAQAAALRETGRLGNRSQAIAVLEQARKLRTSREVQAELTSALAMTDLREIRRFPHGSSNRISADASIASYTALDRDGRVSVRRVTDQSVISTVPWEITDPDSYGPLSPDGRFLVVRPARPAGFQDQSPGNSEFFIWDCQDNIFRQRGLTGNFVIFGPDSRTVAVGSQEGNITFLDVITGSVHGVHPSGLAPARPYSFSPDGTRLVAGASKQTKFSVMEVATGRLLLVGEHPKSARVRCAAWRPDGSGVFIGTESFKIYEWALTDNPIPRQYIGHEGNISSVAVHPDGEWLLSQSDDGSTRLWNTASANTVAELPYSGWEVRFSKDGSHFLCEDREANALHLIEISPSAVCRQFPLPHPDPDTVGSRGCWDIAFSPDGGLLSVADLGGLLLFDGFSGHPKGMFPLHYCWSVVWVPDGEGLFTVSQEGLQHWPVESSLSFINSPAHARTATLGAPRQWEAERYNPQNPSASLSHCAVNADGTLLAQGYADGLGFFNKPNGEKPASLLPTQTPVDGIAVTRDGKLAATSIEDLPGVTVWDTASQRPLRRLPTRFAEASIAFHPDGRRVFTGDLEALSCWEARSGALLWKVDTPGRAWVTPQIALTSDGAVMASNLTAETISLIHSSTGKILTRLRHPSPQPVSGLAFAPDQSRLAVLCLGHLVQLWDLHRLRDDLSARGLDWNHPPLPPRLKPRDWQISA